MVCPAVAPPQAFKLGLVSISFRELSVDEIVDLVRQVQFDGIEWGGDRHVPHGDLETAKSVRERMEGEGLEVSAYGSYYRFEDCDPNAPDKGPDPIAAMDTALELSAPTVRVWAGVAGSLETSDVQRKRIVERAKELAEEASRRRLRIDFEFHENTLTDSAESAVRLLQDIDHPAVGAFWQPPLQMSHRQRLDGLKQALGYVTNIHCNYFGDNPWPGMRPLADGEEEWHEILDTLSELGQRRWISIEHVEGHQVKHFKRDAETLKRWLGR